MEHGFPDPDAADNIAHNPSFGELRRFSREMETATEFGSPAYVSEQRSRSADRTKNTVDHTFSDSDMSDIEAARRMLQTDRFVCVDRRLGRHPAASYTCRLFVPEQYARIALSWAKLLEPAGDAQPDMYTLQVPRWEETKIRVFADDGVTYVLGSDYTGEAKKSFLRLFMYRAKQGGGLGLHAGSKRVTVRNGSDLETVGQVFLGLSATGKSTLTSHGLWLDPPEQAVMLQDDVCAFLPGGTIAGSEGNGLYIKTIDLSAEEQPELYHAATQSHTVLENVAVAEDGTVDFGDDTLTSNSRATILREDLESAADDIDLERVDQLFFITRNPVMPVIARLSTVQAAAAFMLGESIQTSAGDPEKAGEPIRVVGTNPFIMGSKGEEGNRLLDLLEAHDIDAYVLNTGYIGDGQERPVDVEHTVTVLEAVARGDIDWQEAGYTGFEVPEAVPGLDIARFRPRQYFDDFAERVADERQDRAAYLAEFDDLDPRIAEAVY
ncbi:MAG: phosphoenolpyruvate carboxykinase (ATP) [Candidatus Nanohaloarchaea archaeon]|nr:phosphoenolpyruvate carboxykinase (ATP) [Candidatus Nanohaloarchaea archaeon]